MPENSKLAKKKIIFVAIAVIILAIAGAVYLILTESKTADGPVSAVDNSEQQAQAIKDENKDILDEVKQFQNGRLRPIDETDHIKGDIKAPVQIIIYSDFECEYCAEFFETLKKAEAEFGDKIAIAFRHYTGLSHQMALPAAEAAECASEQGKFWEMHDLMYGYNQGNELNPEKIRQGAVELGLDQVKFNQCVEQEKYKADIQASFLEAKNTGVTGTPTFYINGKYYVGAYPYEDFQRSDGSQEKGLKNLILENLNKNL